MKKIIRTATVALSLDVLLKGQLYFLNQKYEIIAVSGNDKSLKEVHIREKVRTVDLPFQRQISPLKDFISLLKLYRLLKKEKPSLIHSITPKAGLLSMIAGYFAKVPVRMHTFTGLIFPSKTGFLKQILIVMDKMLCRFATHVYPEGQGVKNDLIQYKITNKPLQVLAFGNVNGVDFNYFDSNCFNENQNLTLKQSLKIENDDFVFIFVGRIVSDKGINELVLAFKSFQSAYHNTKLLLVGNLEMELDPINKETLHEIRNNDTIIDVGYQNDIRPYLAIANCLTFPSYREGFPNVVIQACAMNLPCIVSDINGCNEIITDKHNGIIIPVKNENAIFDAMKTLFLNKNLYNSLQLNARQSVVSRYSQGIVWSALEEEYERLLVHV
ncbi:MAG: glycosyltransferase family 4 protein [Flavobacterium sp.]|nr:glycosyltransferase family 4 protein [Flavobacterium sp.]